MLAEAQAVRSEADSTTPPTLVLLCQDLERRAAGLDLAEVARWLLDHVGGLQVVLEKDLCCSPRLVRDALRRARAERLVLGLCSGSYPELEVQAHARRAGLDPLGIQAVDVGGFCPDGSGPSPSAKARLLLAAAVARARAFPGSRPENVKAVLLPGRQEVSRRALFTLPPITYQPVPTINSGLCKVEGGCAQCVGACPHAALARDGAAILVDRARCPGCGLCVAACPHRAVELPGWSPEEMEAELDALLGADMEVPERPVLFICKDARAPEGNGWLPVRVPCIAVVSVAAILQALARGAMAVALSPCREECPRGQAEAVRGRVDYCQRLLGSMGSPAGLVGVLGAGPFDFAHRSAGARQGRPFGHAPSPARHAPPNGKGPSGPPRLFGRGAAAQALQMLAAHNAFVGDLALEHASSPLGVVRVDARACTGCGACARGCPTGALTCQRDDEGIALAFDPRLCTGCGECAPLCPERSSGAIRVARATDLRLLSGGPRVLFRDREPRCERCGGPVATRSMLRRIAAALGEGYDAERLGRLCATCRGIPFSA